MVELEELDPDRRPGDFGPNASAVADLIGRAGRLTPAEAHALAAAVGWHWQPLSPPLRGSLASIKAEALAAARVAGRATAAADAMDQARVAALASVGGRATARRWGWAENGVAAVLIGVIGAIVAAQAGLSAAVVAFGVLAVAGAGVVLLYERSRMARDRLAACLEAAVLALVVRDLVTPETPSGPAWAVVRRHARLTVAIDTPAWVRDAVFYQIFPDRFARERPGPQARARSSRGTRRRRSTGSRAATCSGSSSISTTSTTWASTRCT